jgi:phage gpG-like protein
VISIISRFPAWRKLARGLKTQEFRQAALKAAASEAEKLVLMGFRKSADPYGKPWEPLRLRKGKPLQLTGRLRSSFSARPRGPKSIRVGTNVGYAPTHQYGAEIVPVNAKRLAFKVKGRKGMFFAKKVTIPAREMLPRRGLPQQWRKSLSRAMGLSVQRKIKEAKR